MGIQPVEILKWIGIVAAAGFVGYFGRYLAMVILRQTKKEKPPAETTSPAEPSVQLEEARLKLEKKKAKQAAKQAKKSGKG